MPTIKIISDTAIKGKPVWAGDIVEVDASDAHLLCDEYKCAVLAPPKPATTDMDEGAPGEPPSQTDKQSRKKKGEK